MFSHCFFPYKVDMFFSCLCLGDKSSVLDIDDPDLARYPKFADAVRVEGRLEPGDILFIPGTGDVVSLQPLSNCFIGLYK